MPERVIWFNRAPCLKKQQRRDSIPSLQAYRGQTLLYVLQRRLCRGQSRHRHAERRTTHVAQPNTMAELDARRFAAVLAADAELDVRARLAALIPRDFHELADAILVDGGERIVPHDLQFLVMRQERARIVPAHAPAP